MKLLKTGSPYLTKGQWKKVLIAVTIMTIVLYSIAMVCSLLGSKYFILNYENAQMDKIEAFCKEHYLMGLINCVFSTIEFCIVLWFVLKRAPRWYYIVGFYTLFLIPYYIFKHLPQAYYTLFPLVFYLAVLIIDPFICEKRFNWKEFGKRILRLAIAMAVTLIIQIMIYVIKDGDWSLQNHVMSLSATFVYAIEYDIALSVILTTISLFSYREKGDGEQWTTSQHLGGFSQTSKTQSLKSSLTKKQKTKLRLLYTKFYLTQLGAFLLLMVLPFLMGKVVEFLVMYTSFAIIRYLLGFKYSLHYKKETICITVGAVVFGILSLAVPFFYVDVILAILMGVGLAVSLHLSYKYKGFYLFNLVSKPDKFAELYVLMDGDITPHHVKIICNHRGLDKEETEIIGEYIAGDKKSYIAMKHCYSDKTIERKINEAIEKLRQ